ncbi:ATP-dependent DNA helicase RecG [Legionella sp. CNM-4043-24]|uniref:ATP-dependent DNA helicase RecG n=1 Tax=Legionella sp. CNM-4043-24 TaxID=3421646 RepID=UPI00403B25BE
MLTQSCETLSGVGPAIADRLARCGIKTIADLLFHLPYRYQDRTRITPVQDLRLNDYAVVSGRITKTEVTYGKRMMLYCYVEDKTGLIRLRFFHFNKQQAKALSEGSWIRAFGEVRQFTHQKEMIHPEYRLLDNEHEQVMEETLTPIYPLTEGLSQSRLRQLVRLALADYKAGMTDLEWMSEEQLQAHNFLPLANAIELLHSPPPDTSVQALEEGRHPALQRMVFDELLAQRLSMQFARQHLQRLTAPVIPIETRLRSQFLAQLPFALTGAQEKVCAEIAHDLTLDKPMLRLVQGDVGCGKTTVAALAALQVIAHGYQAALMVPTDLLSEQHMLNLQRWLAPLGINCRRLSGKMKARERRETLASLAANECQLLIGTHALFQDGVEFHRLGLIIIDEQHRFGVEQRLLLQQKGQQDNSIPHQLLMTATPIPRTLAMTQFAHLDISVIDELPPGRIPINTAIINQAKREPIIQRLEAAIQEGKQAYWVCTLIEESEAMQCTAATITAETLQKQLPQTRVGLVHGRMKAVEKEATMAAFKQGELDLLVATTVIEVGVDVPNASLMIIENAERLGLSQLHQLRGRVGRGNQQSHCLLLYQTPLSSVGTERLRIMRATNDGFLIAEKDLQLRGAGEVLGTRQTGYRSFRLADLTRDSALLPAVAEMARELLHKSPATAQKIARRWLGDFEQFLQG